jgi:tetratricopeptide (TPR) repeat protein
MVWVALMVARPYGTMSAMAINDKDRKILWGRSGNRCAMCRRVLVAKRTLADREAVVGEEAHIAARSPGGARYGECPSELVDRYENLILLCGVDHKRIDDQPQHFTTTRLRQTKTEHEAWVHKVLDAAPVTGRPQADAGQVVTGNIPWTPPHFVEPLMLPRLLGEAGGSAIFAVTGQRGAGKTQLAAAYARQRSADGWLVAWIDAETPELLANGIIGLADALGIGSADVPFETVARRVRDCLRARTVPSLIVFDNVVDVAAVAPHLPASGRAQVVLTSTSKAVERLGQAVTVEAFDEARAVEYLRAATRLDDDSGAAKLARELGGMPLALAQAAARICEVDHFYEVYLTRLRSLPVDRYLARVDGDQYPYSTAQTILLALESVEDGDDLARLTLNALAAMSPDGVTKDIFLDAAPDPVMIDDTFAKLYRASLIGYAGETRGSIRIHRLVRRVIQERDILAGSVTQTAEVAASLLSRQTFDKHDAWHERVWGAELVGHIEAVWGHAGGHIADEWVLIRVLGLRNWCVVHLTAVQLFHRAIEMGHTVYDVFSAALGDDHLGTRMALTNLGNAYKSGHYPNKAIPFLERAVEQSRRVGAEDEHAAEAMLGLAAAYNAAARIDEANAAARIDEAIALYEEGLAVYHRLGDEVQTMGAQLGLAGALDAAGRVSEAIDLYEQAIVDCERLLGEDHPDTLAAVHNLATTYTKAGVVNKAIPMLERVVTVGVEVLGEDHPSALAAVYNLADAYAKGGWLDEALERLAHNVETCKETFQEPNFLTMASAARLIEVADAIRKGNKTPRVAFTAVASEQRGRPNDDETDPEWLAADYAVAGRLDEAISLYEQSFLNRMETLGPDDPRTMATRSNLATAYMIAGRTDSAVPLHERTLADRVRVLGPTHPDTVASRDSLAQAYVFGGRADDAIPLHEWTVDYRRQTLGPEHPDTLSAQANLATACTMAGQHEDAIHLHEQTLDDRLRLLGEDHPDTLTSSANLAFAYLSAGRLDDSIRQYEPTLGHIECVLGFDDPQTVMVRNSLAEAYRARAERQ